MHRVPNGSLFAPHHVSPFSAGFQLALFLQTGGAGAWTERPPTKRPMNILSQAKRPLNISPQVTFCPSDILSPIYNVPRFYAHP